VSLDLAIAGIRATVDFALEVNRRVGRNQITCVDIGGGLSVNFKTDEHLPEFSTYAAALQEKIPELFDTNVFSRVVTEFGRALIAKQGFFASKIEYVKTTGGRRIAVQYAGADTCVRTIYHPEEWPLRVSLLNENFEPFGGDGFTDSNAQQMTETDLAGPCCIQADIVAHKRLLPEVTRGDTVLLHDVGGYYHSGATTYNLRQNPSVWAFEGEDSDLRYTLLQPQETVDETLNQFCVESERI
jgi:diaminopimelate decarboxylase